MIFFYLTDSSSSGEDDELENSKSWEEENQVEYTDKENKYYDENLDRKMDKILFFNLNNYDVFMNILLLKYNKKM